MEFIDFQDFTELSITLEEPYLQDDNINPFFLWGTKISKPEINQIFRKIITLEKVLSSQTKHVFFSYNKKAGICFFEKQEKRKNYRIILMPNNKLQNLLIEFNKSFKIENNSSLIAEFLNNRLLFSFKKYSVINLPPTLLSKEMTYSEKEVIENPYAFLEKIMNKNWSTPNELVSRIYEMIRTLTIHSKIPDAINLTKILIQSIKDEVLKKYFKILEIFFDYLVDNDEKRKYNVEELNQLREIPDSIVLLGLYYESIIEPVKAINEFNLFLATSKEDTPVFLKFIAMFGLAKTYYLLKRIDLTIRYLVLAESFKSRTIKAFSKLIESLLLRLLITQIEMSEFFVNNNIYVPEEQEKAISTVYELVLTVLQYFDRLTPENKEKVIKRLKKSLKIYRSYFQILGVNTGIIDTLSSCLTFKNVTSQINCVTSQYKFFQEKKILSLTVVLEDGRVLWRANLDEETTSEYEEILPGALSAISSIIEEASGEEPQEIVIPTGRKMFALTISKPFILIVEAISSEKDIRIFAKQLLEVIMYSLPATVPTQWMGDSNEIVMPINTIQTMIQDFESK